MYVCMYVCRASSLAFTGCVFFFMLKELGMMDLFSALNIGVAKSGFSSIFSMEV